MAHYKRRRAKNQRSGCLLCKGHKINGFGGRARETLEDEHEVEAGLEEYFASARDGMVTPITTVVRS